MKNIRRVLATCALLGLTVVGLTGCGMNSSADKDIDVYKRQLLLWCFTLLAIYIVSRIQECSRGRSVSYTHLDVYKRQGLRT